MFQINEDLKNRIINKIPANYTPLQTCVFVYAYLCSTLEYSMDYYANENKFAPNFQDVENLKKVDGINNKEIVCYTFCAIYQSIIESLNLENVEIFHGIELDDDGNFEDYHDSIELVIDGAHYDVDSLAGVLANNDLVDLKFENRKIKYFRLIKTETGVSYSTKSEELQQAINLVHEDLELTKLCDQYITEKSTEFKKLSRNERYALFLRMLEFTPDYSVSSLNYIHLLKQSLFAQEEYHFSFGRDEGKKQYFQISFLRESFSGEIKLLIFYNKNGYNLKEEHNFDTLEISEYSAKSKTLMPITRSVLYERIIDQFYYEIDGYGDDVLKLDSILINMAIDPNLMPI